MVIKIDNDKDIIKFKKRIPLYRTFIFRFTKFKLNKDNKELNEIITALKIKKRKNRITYIYQTLCQKLDNYYQNKNMCEFIDGKCLAQRLSKSDKINGCCRISKYQTNGLCPTKNLACKLFYCDAVYKKHKVITYKDLDLFKCFSPLQRFMVKSDFFTSEKDVINDLYLGIFIATIRVSFRFIKTLIRHRKNI